MKHGAELQPNLEVAGALRDVRERLGLSLRDAAERTEGVLSGPGIARIEQGGRNPSLRSLEALARAYGVEIRIRPDGETTVALTGPVLEVPA